MSVFSFAFGISFRNSSERALKKGQVVKKTLCFYGHLAPSFFTAEVQPLPCRCFVLAEDARPKPWVLRIRLCNLELLRQSLVRQLEQLSTTR